MYNNDRRQHIEEIPFDHILLSICVLPTFELKVKMKKKYNLKLILSFLFYLFLFYLMPPVVLGDEIDSKNGLVKPNQPGDLQVNIVVSDSPHYIREWVHSKPKKVVRIKRLDKVRPNQVMYTAFLITGYKLNEENFMDVVIHWVFYEPNGRTMFKQDNYAHAKKRIKNNTPNFIMADPALDLELDTTDPQGVYRLVAIAEDRISKKIAKNVYKIDFEINK